MSIGAILNTSVQGMQAQSTRLAATANNAANIDNPGYSPLLTNFAAVEPGGVHVNVGAATGEVDEAGEMLDMIEAREGVEANASVFETGASLWDMLLSIKR